MFAADKSMAAQVEGLLEEDKSMSDKMVPFCLSLKTKLQGLAFVNAAADSEDPQPGSEKPVSLEVCVCVCVCVCVSMAPGALPGKPRC